MKRVFLVAVLPLVLAMSATAAAQEYPPSEGDLEVSDSTVTPGGTITVEGTGCEADSDVTITFDDDEIDATTADGDGAFSESVDVPDDASEGTHTLEATCPDADGTGNRVLGIQITVSDEGGLAATGSSSTVPLTLVGAGIALLGVVLVVVVRQRSGAKHDAL